MSLKTSILSLLLAALLLPGVLMHAQGQGSSSEGDTTPDGGIPTEVFYLMPSFGHGMVYLRGQGPAEGQMNICAVDQTLRFIDDSGTELAAADHDIIIRVRIDTATFIRHQDAFLRLHPVMADMGIAVKREVRIIRDAKMGAYGGTSQTSSISEVGTLYTEGAALELRSSRNNPYSVSETHYVYNGDTVLLPTRGNLRKLFPSRRADIDAYFKSHRSFPEDLAEAKALLAAWGQ